MYTFENTKKEWNNFILNNEPTPNYLVLIRGLPGSGKSTVAKGLHDFVHYEADMFFMREGKYCFDGTKVKSAHKWCIRKTREALMSGKDVVVSNTFTRMQEMMPYIKMGYTTFVLEAPGQWKNIHGVPDETIQRMKARWETLIPNQLMH